MKICWPSSRSNSLGTKSTTQQYEISHCLRQKILKSLAHSSVAEQATNPTELLKAPIIITIVTEGIKTCIFLFKINAGGWWRCTWQLITYFNIILKAGTCEFVEDLQSWLRQWISAQLTDRSDLQVIKELRLIGHILRMACHPIDLNLALTQILVGLQSSAVTADCSGEENCLRTTLDYLSKSYKQLVLFDVGANQGQWSTCSTTTIYIFWTQLQTRIKTQNNATNSWKFWPQVYMCLINMIGVAQKQPQLFVSNQSSEMAIPNRGGPHGEHEHLKTRRQGMTMPKQSCFKDWLFKTNTRLSLKARKLW